MKMSRIAAIFLAITALYLVLFCGPALSADDPAVKPVASTAAASKPAKPSDSFAANAVTGFGAEVNLQTGQLEVSLECVKLAGITEDMELNLGLSRHDVLPGADSTLYNLPSGWKWDLDYVDTKNEVLCLSGSASLTIDSQWQPSGLRYVKSRMFRIETFQGALAYDKREYSYRFTMLNGSGRYFDRYGRLICVDDRFGNHILYRYDRDDYIENSSLAEIIDSYGQHINITYSGGQPAKEVVITMPDKRTASLNFDITPTYDSRITIVNPEGRKILIKLFPDRTVREIAYPSGGSVQYDYMDNAISYQLARGEQPRYFSAVGSVTEDPVSGNSEKSVTQYSYRSTGRFYTGYPEYAFGDDELLLSGNNAFSFSTQVTAKRSEENGGEVTSVVTFNHLNLETLRELSQGGEVKQTILPVYEGQDATGLFPPFSQLGGNYSRTVETIEKTAGHTVNNEKLTYNEDGLLSQSVERTGPATATTDSHYFDSYGLEKSSSLKDSADSMGVISSVNRLDATGKYIAETVLSRNAEKMTTIISRDSHGRVLLEKVQSAAGAKPNSTTEKTSYSYSFPGSHELTTTTTDSLGRETSVTVDTRNGFVTKETNAMGRSVTYRYENNGLLVTKTYPDGSWEKEDRTDPAKTLMTSSSGEIITEYLDGFGRLIKRTDSNGPGGSERTLYSCTYNELGEIATETDMFSRTTSRFYDWKGRETRAIDSLKNVTKTDYDDTNLTETKSYNGIKLLQTGYNDRGDIVKSADYQKGQPGSALYPVTEFEYNGKGQQISSKLSFASDIGDSGRQVLAETSSYDLGGNGVMKRTKTSDGASSATEALFNAFDYVNSSKITCSGFSPGIDGAMKSFGSEAKEYDAAGNIIKVTNQSGQSMSFTYDKNSNRTSMTDFSGSKTEYEYDKMDRLVSVKSGHMAVISRYYAPGSPSEGLIQSRELKADGKIRDKIEYVYDQRGLLVKTRYMNGKERLSEYDAYDRLASATDINGVRTVITYDERIPENIIRIESQYGSIEYKYFAPQTGGLFGQGTILREISCSNGMKINYEYYAPDANDAKPGPLQIKSITTTGAGGTLLSSSLYQYDERGHISMITRTSGEATDPVSSNIRKFTYNDTGQLISDETLSLQNAGLSKTSYVYDIRGNILSMTVGRENGKNIEKTTYEYDADNRLKTATGPDGKKTSFACDANGGIVSITANGKVLKRFEYNELGQLSHYTDGDGSDVSYSYNAEGLRSLKKDNRTGYSITYYYDSDRDIVNEEDSRGVTAATLPNLLRVAGDRAQWFVSDMKDVLGYTDEKGSGLAESYAFTSYGEDSGQSASSRKSRGSFSISTNPYGYSGYFRDDESGMYYLKARAYSPELMRFTSRDSNDLTNRYAYADGNPVELIDPDGESAIVVLAIVSISTGIAGTMSHVAANNWVENDDWKTALNILGAAFDITSLVTGAKAYKLRNIEKSRRTAMEKTRLQTLDDQKYYHDKAERIQTKGIRASVTDYSERQLKKHNKQFQLQFAEGKSRYRKMTKWGDNKFNTYTSKNNMDVVSEEYLIDELDSAVTNDIRKLKDRGKNTIFKYNMEDPVPQVVPKTQKLNKRKVIHRKKKSQKQALNEFGFFF